MLGCRVRYFLIQKKPQRPQLQNEIFFDTLPNRDTSHLSLFLSVLCWFFPSSPFKFLFYQEEQALPFLLAYLEFNEQ